jgi:hypothetical protein
MPYIVLFGVISLWVLFDGISRNMKAIAVLWALGTVVLGAIVIPIYVAKRPLKNGEVREGGTPWNLLKNFAILWTIIMIVASIYVLHGVGKATSGLDNDWAMAGAGIGIVVVVGTLGAIWFFPTIGAAILGFFLKKNSVIETGPSGSMLESESKASALSGWAGIGAVSVVALVILLVSQSSASSTPSKPVSESPTPAGVTSPLTPPAGWSTRESRSEMDGTREVTLMLDAENQISGILGQTTPNLIIRCSKHKTELYVNVGEPFQSVYGEIDSVRVRLKLDDSAPFAQTWSESTDDKAAFAPSAQKLAKQLETVKLFRFEFTPFEKRETTVTFNLADLKKNLDPISDVCGISNGPAKN